ncbi:hypothetical protein [Alteromonas sp. CYL-A6]
MTGNSMGATTQVDDKQNAPSPLAGYAWRDARRCLLHVRAYRVAHFLPL